jgi:hypothetical protein
MVVSMRTLAEDCLRELDVVSSFIHKQAFDTHPAPPGARPHDDTVLAELIRFVDGLDMRIEELRRRFTTATAATAVVASAPTDKEPDLNETLSGGNDDEEGRRSAGWIHSHRPSIARPWTFGASFRSVHSGHTAVTAFTPEELTPMRRSMSVAYGRRRRSTIHLAGMPGFTLDPAMAATPALNIKTTRHTHVLRKPLDVRHALQEAQLPYLEAIDQIDFDACIADSPAYRRQYNGLSTLTVVAVNVFCRYTFMSALRIDVPKLIAFLSALDRLHRSENPFHNSLHAANCIHTVHAYLKLPTSQKESLTDLQLCALLVAAVVMNVGHLGVHDAFLDVTTHPLKVIYPEGTQKGMSLSMALALLFREDCHFLADCFGNSKPGDRDVTASFREEFVFFVSHLVRLADETLHAELMAQLIFIQEKNYAGDDQVIFVLAGVLRVANASHALKSPSLCHEWLSRAAAEGFREGSAQLRWYCRERGLDLHGSLDSLDDAQVAPHLQPPSLNRDMSVVDFFHSSLKNYLAPIVNFPKGYFGEEWKERLEANITALSGHSVDDKFTQQILSRSRELFDYERLYLAHERQLGTGKIDLDATEYFKVLRFVQGRQAHDSGNQLPSEVPSSPRERRLVPGIVGSPAGGTASPTSTGALLAIATLVSHCRQWQKRSKRRMRLASSDSHEADKDQFTELLAFSQQWVELLYTAEAMAPGTAFVLAPEAPLFAGKFIAKADGPHRCVKSRCVDEIMRAIDEPTCLSIVRSLSLPSGNAAAHASSNANAAVRQIVSDLTNLCLESHA